MGWTYGVMGETQITASRANPFPAMLGRRSPNAKHSRTLTATFCSIFKYWKLSLARYLESIPWFVLIDWLIGCGCLDRQVTHIVFDGAPRVLWATIYLLPSSEWSSIDICLNLRGWSLPERFSSSVGSFTSTLNVRVEGTSTLRGMRATRGTPPNVEEQRN